MRFEGYRISGELLTIEDPSSSDLLSYAAGRGHREYPCLSRAHNPTSCVPCIDFSPWLRERVRRGEADAMGEYLWRVRRADPDVSGSSEQILRKYLDQAYSIMATPLDRHLDRGSEDAYTDLRVALVLLAAHETFSGFIMAGESADFMASVMLPHSFSLTGILELVAFLEERFGITVLDADIVPDNLDSISSIAAYVERRRSAASVAA